MGRIEKLAKRYKRYVSLPWQKDLAGAQRAIFVVYGKTGERRLVNRKELFALATAETKHNWKEVDLTRVFSQWMASIDYRESYFESPDDLELKLDGDFFDYKACRYFFLMNVQSTANRVNNLDKCGIYFLGHSYSPDFILASKKN